jgi:hypothetical protein
VRHTQRMGSSPIIRFYSPVAQLGERLSYKEDVTGSIPVRTINNGSVAQWIERCASDADVVGSSPSTLATLGM